ncbi:MAG: tetratricopeptide (TPR) repeat protein [Flavobacteriales bacterium]|jgi:tetratricopeptide (TPR) repeat protein
MINKNKIGDVTGDGITIIQITLPNGEKVEEKLHDLLEPLLSAGKKEIETLQRLIISKGEAVDDKKRIVELQGTEIDTLKTKLSEKEIQLKKSETLYAKLFLENNGKDFTGLSDLYSEAINALTKGDRNAAIRILDRQKMLDLKANLEEEKLSQAKSWLLKADLLKDEFWRVEEIEECYNAAVEIYPCVDNYLKASIFFTSIEKFERADQLLQVCLLTELTALRKASVLNRIGVSYSVQNQHDKSVLALLESITLCEQESSQGNQKALLFTASVLANLAVSYIKMKKYNEAKDVTNRALQIRQDSIGMNDFESQSSLLGVYFNKGNLHLDCCEFKDAEKSFLKAIELVDGLEGSKFEIDKLLEAYICLLLADLYKVQFDDMPASMKYATRAGFIYQDPPIFRPSILKNHQKIKSIIGYWISKETSIIKK